MGLGARCRADCHLSFSEVSLSGGDAGDPEPAQRFVPNLSCEEAGEEKVVHGFRCLVTKGVSCGVLQATAGKAVRNLASVQVGEPMKEPDAR